MSHNMADGMSDEIKSREIKKILKKNPAGVWIRELARKTKLSRSTVSRYVCNELRKDVKIEWAGRNKLIKLK